MNAAAQPILHAPSGADGVRVVVNGRPVDTLPNRTILDACRSAGISIPTLCHDDRLKSCGACRLCLVHLKGRPNLVTACSTPVAAGMEIETHTAEIETTRRTLLELLAANYPPDAPASFPDKPFHRFLREYNVRRHLHELRAPRPARATSFGAHRKLEAGFDHPPRNRRGDGQA